ncbi:MAG: hypothetical protein CM1200mP18_12760 [Gammaproteobacteria bacterium]|nr:MAG: hypothetical protein CM1200mP18_12760 [Gammaproteobacteria bacterium]
MLKIGLIVARPRPYFLTTDQKTAGVFVEDPRQQVTIRYPGGDKGNAWALELREWLVALGIPSNYIVLEPGSGGQDRLLLLLEAGDT